MKTLFIALSLLASSAAFAQSAAESLEAHRQARITAIEAGLDPKFDQAMRSLVLGKRKKDVLRCWIYGFDVIIGLHTGACRGGGRKYSLAAIGIGISSQLRVAYLKLKATGPFESNETLAGSSAGFYTVFGTEGLQLHPLQGHPKQVSGSGFGLGVGFEVQAIRVMLDEVQR